MSPENYDSRLLGTVVYIVTGCTVSIYLDCFYDIEDYQGFLMTRWDLSIDRSNVAAPFSELLEGNKWNGLKQVTREGTWSVR
jgi:hypothetical protein